MKTYTAWTKNKRGGQEVLTECLASSAKHFKKIIEENNAVVTSRIRIKKTK